MATRDARDYPHAIDSKDGERGRNRTYNLLIKSQLLCQLSYAPGINGKVRTNTDYIIRICAACTHRRRPAQNVER